MPPRESSTISMTVAQADVPHSPVWAQLWLAGIGALAAEHRWINDGLDQADSYCTNPHKWMGVNFDCDLFYTADRAALLGALSILPEYLRSAAAEAGAVIDYRDWQVPLGRRFRALKVWFTVSTFGIEKLGQTVAETCRLARVLALREVHVRHGRLRVGDATIHPQQSLSLLAAA